MKKMILVLIIAMATIAGVSAQPWNGQQARPGMGPGYGYGQQGTGPAVAAPDKVTVEGKLSLVNGRIALTKDGKTYYVMLPRYLFGFVDGLNEGAAVSVEGYAMALPAVKDGFALHATKLVVNGRTIDLPATAGPMGGQGQMGGRGQMGGQGQMGGRGQMGGQGQMGGRGQMNGCDCTDGTAQYGYGRNGNNGGNGTAPGMGWRR